MARRVLHHVPRGVALSSVGPRKSPWTTYSEFILPTFELRLKPRKVGQTLPSYREESVRWPTMIPVPPGPSDVVPSPEPFGGIPRGGASPPPLVLAAFDEIEGLKRLIAELQKRLEALEQRVAGMASIEQRVTALEAARS